MVRPRRQSRGGQHRSGVKNAAALMPVEDWPVCQGCWAQTACKFLCQPPFRLLSYPRDGRQRHNWSGKPLERIALSLACLSTPRRFASAPRRRAAVADRPGHDGPGLIVRAGRTGRCATRIGQFPVPSRPSWRQAACRVERGPKQETLVTVENSGVIGHNLKNFSQPQKTVNITARVAFLYAGTNRKSFHLGSY